MKIVKRDGHIVDYDPEKIRVAIGKANEEVRGREKATKEEIKEIKNNSYERLEHKRDKIDIVVPTKVPAITNNFKNPILLELKDKEIKSESDLEKLIYSQLSYVFLQLGSGFAWIGNQYKVSDGNKNYFIDMLLYNVKYNCYVVVELKVTELKKEHIGQIEVYMNYIDKHIKTINQDKTIGIIITKRDNRYYIEYSSDKRILTREYILN